MSHVVCTVGNTVGSLSETQHQVVIGTLLGDGTMRCRANALLEVNHSIRQRSYVDWKYQQLAELVRTPPKSRRSNGERVAYRFVTRSLAVLTPYYWRFYRSGEKRIPDLEIGPLALAVWFMDDGSRSRSAVYFNTQQFDVDDQMRLLAQLWKQHGLRGALNKDKEYFRIRLSTQSTRRLAAFIGDLVLPQMRYKFPQMTP